MVRLRQAWVAASLVAAAILFGPCLASAQGINAGAALGPGAGDPHGFKETRPQVTGMPDAAFDPEVEYANGLTDLEFGCYVQARQDFRNVLSVQPKHTRALFLMGVAYTSSGDRAGAADAYQKAVKIDPQMIDAQRELAVTLALQGQADKARVLLNRLKTLARDCVGACPDAELIKNSVTRIEAALAGQFDEVMRPASAPAVCTALTTAAARNCFSAAKFGDLHGNGAGACAAALGSALPDEVKVRVLVDRGVIRLSDNKARPAIEDFDAAIAMNGQLGEAYTNRGAAHLALKEYDQAKADIDRGLALGSGEPQRAWYNRGIADEHLGDGKAAYLDFLKAAKLDPSWAAPKAELTHFAVEEHDSSE
jgi:tetratricopeptide (TPR) repeat protein